MPALIHIARFRDFVVRAYDQISRVAGKSPEGTGAVAALVVVAVFSLAMATAGGHLRSPADEISAHQSKGEAELPAAPEPPLVQPSLSAAVAPSGTVGQIGDAFVERFDGDAINESRWFISDGWTNGDWMENDWRRSQVELTEGGLRLALGPGPAGSAKPLASGEIRTHAQFRYGYFEVRMRVPRGPGLVTGVFTYASSEGRTKPNEIDIEILGRSTRRVALTIHQSGRPTTKTVNLPFDAADSLHTYAIEWLPDRVRWYADGTLLHEEAGRAVASLTRPQQFFLSPWASSQLHKWVGKLDPSGGPWALDIACAAYSPSRPSEPLCS